MQRVIVAPINANNFKVVVASFGKIFTKIDDECIHLVVLRVDNICIRSLQRERSFFIQ